MLFKVAAVLLAAVLHASVVAGATSIRPGLNAVDIEAGVDGVQQTNFVRRMKKDKNKDKANKKKNDEEVEEEVEDEVEEEDDDEDETEDELEEDIDPAGETSEDAIQGIIPANIRTMALGNDISDWNHGSYAVSSGKDGTIKVYAPEGTRVGDTLFLFLRYVRFILVALPIDWQL